jgi:hypothetical protein
VRFLAGFVTVAAAGKIALDAMVAVWPYAVAGGLAFALLGLLTSRTPPSSI